MRTKYRGAQVAPDTQSTPQAWRDLLDAGANILRYQIIIFDRSKGEAWKSQVRDVLNYLDAELLPLITTQRVILDIHWTPGDLKGFWTDQEAQDTFYEMWHEIAARYSEDYRIYAFDILNEPTGSYPQVKTLMEKAYGIIRSVAPKKMIMVTPPYSDPRKFLNFTPYEGMKNIYYEMHFYRPFAFTGQGIGSAPVGKKYPSATCTKNTLIRWLDDLRNWQLKYNITNIYIGEFAASIWADPVSRLNYYRDLISIFEHYNWQWTYHAWREFHGWDIENDPNLFGYIKSMWAKNR